MPILDSSTLHLRRSIIGGSGRIGNREWCPSLSDLATISGEPVKIGGVELRDQPVFLAPMEDVSDPPFRILCKRYGADLLYTEFISSGGLAYQAEESLKKLEFSSFERPIAIQIFGGDPDQVREATRIVNGAGPDILDINFGCPVRKVVCSDGGAGILRNLSKMRTLTEIVLEESACPVTVKTRLGWDESTIQIIEVARMLEEVGIQALAVHARTRSQMYKGQARWDWLKRIRDQAGIEIPLIGNGDASTPEKIRDMFEQTGVDAVMVGRGAIGNPWIFRDARALMESGEVPPPPLWQERIEVVAEHLRLKCEWLGERRGVLEMRKMYGGYFKSLPGSQNLRKQLMAETRADRVLEILLNSTDNTTEIQISLAG